MNWPDKTLNIEVGSGFIKISKSLVTYPYHTVPIIHKKIL